MDFFFLRTWNTLKYPLLHNSSKSEIRITNSFDLLRPWEALKCSLQILSCLRVLRLFMSLYVSVLWTNTLDSLQMLNNKHSCITELYSPSTLLQWDIFKPARWTRTHRPWSLPTGFPGNCYLSWINARLHQAWVICRCGFCGEGTQTLMRKRFQRGSAAWRRLAPAPRPRSPTGVKWYYSNCRRSLMHLYSPVKADLHQD